MIFASRLEWLPVGKFIDPEVWLDATVSTNYVFYFLLLTAGGLLAALAVSAYLVQKWRGRHGDVLLRIVVAGLVGLAVLGWTLSGIGHLALDIVKHMVLPVLTLTLVSFAGTMLLTRTSTLETLREDYVLAAALKDYQTE